MPSRSSILRIRLACVLVLLAVAQFVVVQGIAIARYPGGHEWDKNAPGHSFWRNTLSDLGRTVTIAGQINPMSIPSRVSTVLLLLSTGVVWMILPRLFPQRPRLGWLVRGLGLLSLGGMVALGFTPADQFPFAHAAANGTASVPGLTAYLFACWGMFRSRTCPYLLIVVSLIFLLLAIIHFGQYVAHFWLGYAWTPQAPAVQRLAFLAGLAWMVLVSVGIFRRAGRPFSSDKSLQ